MRSIICSLLFALVALPAHAQFAPLRNASPFYRNGASLDMDFVGGNYMVSVTSPVTYTSLTAFLADINVSGTFSRNSMGTYFDSSGTLQTAPANTPRLDYDPVTHAAKGLLIEETRTNNIRNNTMVGAVSGTGSLPTYWTAGNGNGLGGLTQQVVGAGTQSGISYVDLHYYGTPSATTYINVGFEPPTTTAAANGQSWTNSVYFAIVSGSTANLRSMTLNMAVYYTSPTNVYLGEIATATSLMSATSTLTRYMIGGTIANASATNASPYSQFAFTNGSPVDITLRYGMPQLEQGAFPTSVISTSTAAVTRQADKLIMPTGNWYAQGVGTLLSNVVIPYEISSSTTDPTSRLAGFDDGTAANGLSLGINHVSNGLGQASVIIGSSFIYNKSSAATFSNNALIKGAMSYDGSTASSAFNGVSLGSASSASPGSLTIFRVGGVAISGVYYLNGWATRAVYFPATAPPAALLDYTR